MNQQASVVNANDTAVSQQRLIELEITQLKNLKDVTLPFNEGNLTAIMGPNCCGKTTVLHALACAYRPDQGSPNYKFPLFFKPNTDSLWHGSRFAMTYSMRVGKATFENLTQSYAKADRWTPRYEKRPVRYTRFVMMKESLPEVETVNLNAMIHYKKSELTGDAHNEARDAAGYVLNREYQAYHSVVYRHGGRASIGVTSAGLSYPALSMSSGEQRVFKIMSAVIGAPKYALILIDEIDLFLHQDALTRLLTYLNDHCKKHHKQLVFTTHFPQVADMYKDIPILSLYRAPERTVIWSGYSYTAMRYITGVNEKPISIFVEDDVAGTIVQNIARSLKIRGYVEIGHYGPAQNAAALGAGLILANRPTENVLIVMDGDVLASPAERRKQIGKALTGTTNQHKDQRHLLRSICTRLWDYKGESPERVLHRLIRSLDPTTLHPDVSEIFNIAQGINSVQNPHDFINKIIGETGETREVGLTRIVSAAAKASGWTKYTRLVRDWMVLRKQALGFVDGA